MAGQDKKRKQNIFLDIEPEPYKMPFEDLAPNDPDVEQMRQIVSVKNERPEFRTELCKSNFYHRPLKKTKYFNKTKYFSESFGDAKYI